MFTASQTIQWCSFPITNTTRLCQYMYIDTFFMLGCSTSHQHRTEPVQDHGLANTVLQHTRRSGRDGGRLYSSGHYGRFTQWGQVSFSSLLFPLFTLVYIYLQVWHIKLHGDTYESPRSVTKSILST
jgi:hypothetical protein